MNKEERLDLLDKYKSVRYRIDEEGIDYCFEHYSRFDEIKDDEFHKLRLDLIDAIVNMRTYVDDMIKKLDV